MVKIKTNYPPLQCYESKDDKNNNTIHYPSRSTFQKQK